MNRRFVAYARSLDLPGALTAVADVVSSRGVSIDSFATGEVVDGAAVLTLVFSTSDRLERLIARTLSRVAVVTEVLVLPVDDPDVLAVGVVHATPGLRFRPAPDSPVTWSGDLASGQPLLVEGAFVDVEAVLSAARAAGASRVSSALLPPGSARWRQR